MNESDYVAAVDDSGGIEPLVRWDGSPIAGDHPITVLATAFIKRDRLIEFNDAWTDLRLEIQKELGCSQIPPIHMRIMWGKDLKKTYRGGPNPYLGADFESIKQWYAKALGIAYRFNRDNTSLAFWTSTETRAAQAVRYTAYFQTPEFLAEMMFLRSHSRRRHKKMYVHYHNRITSPLLPLFTGVLPFLNESMRISRNKTVELLVDPFGESHGVDAKEVYHSISQLTQLTQITSVERVGNADEQPICQVADVIGYTHFRRTMIELKHINPDPHMMNIFDRFAFKPSTTANLPHIVGRRYPDFASLTMTIHYAIARQQIAEDNPEFTREYMVSVEEFYERAKALKYGDKGVSILNDPTVCADILAGLENDEDRG